MSLEPAKKRRLTGMKPTDFKKGSPISRDAILWPIPVGSQRDSCKRRFTTLIYERTVLLQAGHSARMAGAE